MIRWVFRHSMYALALTAGGLAAWAAHRPSIEGSGRPLTEQRGVRGEPTEVVISGVGEAVLVQGPEPAVEVTADDNIVPHLRAETSGRRLTLSVDRSSLQPKTAIRYRVTLPTVTAVTVSGAASVVTEKLQSEKLSVKLSGAGKVDLRELTCRELSLSLSGAGKANVAGAAEKATLKLSGAGIVDASGLKVGTADVNLSGAGKANVWPDALKARVSGAGVVRYKGSPQIDQRVSGAGTVRPLD